MHLFENKFRFTVYGFVIRSQLRCPRHSIKFHLKNFPYCTTIDGGIKKEFQSVYKKLKNNNSKA